MPRPESKSYGGISHHDWFKNQLKEFEKDPQFQMECSMMDVTEGICKMYGQPKGIYGILFWLLNWSADKLIWRTKQMPRKPKKKTLHIKFIESQTAFRYLNGRLITDEEWRKLLDSKLFNNIFIKNAEKET